MNILLPFWISMCDKSRNTWLCVHWQWNTLEWCQLNALQASPVVHLVTPLSCVSLSMNTQPSVPTIISRYKVQIIFHLDQYENDSDDDNNDMLLEKEHCRDVIMGAIASQITSLTIVYSNGYSGADQIKHQSSASLAFVGGIHQSPVNSPHKWPVTRKMFPFDDVIMGVLHADARHPLPPWFKW